MDLQASLGASLSDQYEIERELGGGGMSRVFVATEKRLAVAWPDCCRRKPDDDSEENRTGKR